MGRNLKIVHVHAYLIFDADKSFLTQNVPKLKSNGSLFDYRPHTTLTRPNEFGSMTARKSDTKPWMTIKRPYKAT